MDNEENEARRDGFASGAPNEGMTSPTFRNLTTVLSFAALGAICACAARVQDLGGEPGGVAAGDDGGSDGGQPIFGGDVGGACTLSNRWIAFDSDRDAFNRNVFIARADGTDVRRLTNDPAVEREPSFSPDGRHVAFASDLDGTMQIYVLDVVTHAKVKVSARTEAASRPSFSFDGSKIVFSSGGLLYLANPDGSGDRLFATPPSPQGLLQSLTQPTFLPNGSVLAPQANGLALVEPDGTNKLLYNAYPPKYAAVTLDGRTMALADEYSCHDVIIAAIQPLLPCAGRRLGDSAIDEVAFGPDNALAVTKGNPGDIFVAQTSCRVTNDPADDRSPSWAPVGFQGAESVPIR